MMEDIILASQSPRRKQLLEWAEVPFEVIVKHTNEDFPADLAIEDVPVYIARQKALAVQSFVQEGYHKQHHHKLIIAADTVVVLNDTIIGKPTDRDDAIQMLSALSGKQHRVITGVVLVKDAHEIAFADTTFVQFHPLTEEQIVYYVDNYQPYDKAGAYAIQEWIGVVGIKTVQGDFYNVMGLPVSRVLQAVALINK